MCVLEKKRLEKLLVARVGLETATVELFDCEEGRKTDLSVCEGVRGADRSTDGSMSMGSEREMGERLSEGEKCWNE